MLDFMTEFQELGVIYREISEGISEHISNIMPEMIILRNPRKNFGTLE